jgi:hypothetical protein
VTHRARNSSSLEVSQLKKAGLSDFFPCGRTQEFSLERSKTAACQGAEKSFLRSDPRRLICNVFFSNRFCFAIKKVLTLSAEL